MRGFHPKGAAIYMPTFGPWQTVLWALLEVDKSGIYTQVRIFIHDVGVPRS